jgi:LCP family protein required for cell wall assembly
VSTGERTSPVPSGKSHRGLVVAVILVLLAVSAYLALVIITHVDSVFFPGNQISVPGGSAIQKVVPGIDLTGDSGSQKRINILVVGIDRRPTDGSFLTRTDTMEVVSIDPKTKSATMLGIPRDLWVNIPRKSGGTYQDRINTTLVEAESQDYPEGPIGLLKETIRLNLNITIDHYVLVDFNGFRKIIDDLGGIDVDVPDEVYDPYYSETEKPGDYDPQHFYPGVQHMDGSTALAYSRIRYSSDDLDRIQRQQRVMFAVIDKVKSEDALFNIKNAGKLWNEYKSTIQTDISDAQIAGYALLASQVKDSIRAVSLGPATTPCTYGQAQVLCTSQDALAPILQAVFSDKTPTGADGTATPPVPVAVQVQNGTGTDSLASHVADFLASKGYPVNDLNTANAFDGQKHTQSEIIDVSGSNTAAATEIAAWLNIPASRIRTATASEKSKIGDGPEIVVVLGSDGNFAQLIQSPTTSVSGG